MIFVLIREKPWWNNYEKNAIDTSDKILRQRFLKGIFVSNSLSPIVQRQKSTLFEFCEFGPLLIKAFEINTRLKAETLQAAGALAETAKELGSQTVLGTGLIEGDN